MYFIGSLRLGGAEKQVVELALGLDRSRFRVEICCLNQGGPMVDAVRADGIPVHIFNTSLPWGKFNPRSWIHLARHLWGILRQVRHSRPDIIHGYLFTAYVTGIICGKIAGVPVLISSRRSLGFFKEDKPWRQPLENFVNRWTHAIIPNSKAVLEDCIRRERNGKGKYRVIYNGVDVERYSTGPAEPSVRAEWGIAPGDLLVGCVANLIHYKGHLEILEAAALLRGEFPRLRFVFVGRDGGMEKAIVEKRDTLGLRDCVILAGSRSDVARLIPAFDVLLLASHEEGFSNVLLEGMACGRPIVATAVGGNAESVIHQETGLIIPPRDPVAMAEALAALLRDSDLMRRFGNAGRIRVEREFSRERMIRDMDEFYLDIAAKSLGKRT